ncbi:helix-turn-helix domain-containing protein [Bifidobacterium breve]|uniref:helix-turn-helix domain-containing protein n=1 Tax=Bifidobacterium breve TaxID=1685 RepID=UPI001F0C114A|nr:helix-turn-helix domain-containing protein [Bifidobacterium breve]
MFSLEERERAVELYFTTPMTTAQVVEHLGYPTRQCLERWLAMDSRYAGHMAKPIIPLETRRRAVEPVLGGMQQKQAAKQLGVSVGAVHGWVRAYRKGGMAALQPKNRNSAQGNKPADSRRRPSAADDDDAPRRAISPRTPAAGRPQPMMMTRRLCAAGSRNRSRGNALMREVAEARRKRPRRRPAAPVEQGEDPVDRPVEAGVFAQVDDMLARHRAQQLPLPPRPARR